MSLLHDTAKQLIKSILDPPPILIAPDISGDNCIGMVMHKITGLNLETPSYKNITGESSYGRKIQMLDFDCGYCVDDMKDKDNCIPSHYLGDIIDGKYKCFPMVYARKTVSIYYDGTPACVMYEQGTSTAFLYKQGNLPWCNSQRAGYDTINIFMLGVQYTGGDVIPIHWLMSSSGLHKGLLTIGLVIGSPYALMVDIQRLVESIAGTNNRATVTYGTEINPLIDRHDNTTFSTYGVTLVINNIFLSIEPDLLLNRRRLLPDRPIWFLTEPVNMRDRYIVSLYDTKLRSRLIPRLCELMIRVFANMVGRYLARTFE